MRPYPPLRTLRSTRSSTHRPRLVRPFARVAAMVALALSGLAAEAGISGLSGDDVRWSHLHYGASRGIATLNVDLDLAAVPAGQLDQAKAAADGLPGLVVPHGQVLELRARIHLKHLFGDYITDDRVWFNGHDAGAVQRRKERTGNKEYVKTYRYQPTGTHRKRVRPADKAQRKKPAADWTDRSLDTYNYGAARQQCKVVSEPGLLFFVASAHDFSDNRPVQLCVFSDDSLFHMTIEPVGRETIPVDYSLTKNGKRTRVKEDLLALRLRVTPTLLPGGSDKADFEILDFKGSQDLFVDPARRLPVRISGSLPGMGRGDVNVDAVTLR